MPDTYQVKRNGLLILTLTAVGMSVSGDIAYRPNDEVDGALSRFGRWFRDLALADRQRDRQRAADTMEELYSERVNFYRNGRFVPYRELGMPTLQDAYFRFRPIPTRRAEVTEAPTFPLASVEESNGECHHQWLPLATALAASLTNATPTRAVSVSSPPE